MHRALLSARLKPCPDVTARPELHKPKINCAKIANCSGRRSAEGRDTCLAHWPRTSHECELGLEGLLLHPVPLRNFGGTWRSVDSPPRKGNNRISEASICPGASKMSETNRLRLEPLLQTTHFTGCGRNSQDKSNG